MAVGIDGAAVHGRVQRADPRIRVLLVGAEGATDNVLDFGVLALFGLVGFHCLGFCSREGKKNAHRILMKAGNINIILNKWRKMYKKRQFLMSGSSFAKILSYLKPRTLKMQIISSFLDHNESV